MPPRLRSSLASSAGVLLLVALSGCAPSSDVNFENETANMVSQLSSASLVLGNIADVYNPDIVGDISGLINGIEYSKDAGQLSTLASTFDKIVSESREVTLAAVQAESTVDVSVAEDAQSRISLAKASFDKVTATVGFHPPPLSDVGAVVGIVGGSIGALVGVFAIVDRRRKRSED